MATEPAPSPNGDPLLARLERLSRRPWGGVDGRFAPPSTPVLGPPMIDPPAQQRPAQSSSKPSPKKPVARRRHPARGARYGALAISCAATGGLAYLFAGTDANSTSAGALVSLPQPIATTPASTTATSTAPAADTPATAATTATTAAQAATASLSAFNGDTIETKYGPVQVQVQIQAGAVVDVAVVQYPSDDGKSVRINQRALPELRSEVLTAQSSSVHTISGATYTSDGYTKSLQSALDEARTAGATTLA